MTRTQRTYAVAAAVAAIVTAANASQGAYFSQSWGWVALAFLVPTTVLLILDRVDTPGRLRIAFAALMVALAVWIALSATWSISTPATVREVERILVYVAVALAVAFVLRRGDGPGVAAGAAVGIVLVVAYGLGTRLMPDRLGTPDDAFNDYRLAAPIGYWNSFGVLAAMGAVLAIGAVAHARRGRHAALAGGMVPMLLVALYFTFSRGSWIALAFAVAATLALDPRRLRLLWSLVVLGVPAGLAIALASREPALTNQNSPVQAAVREGHRLAWILAGLVAFSAVLGWLAHRVAEAVPMGPRQRRGVDVLLAGAVVAVAVVALVAAGGDQAFGNLRERFEADPTASGSDLNGRLFSVSGNGRGETLGVAWHMAREHPLAGMGSGSFEYVWYEERPSLQVVRDAHSLYAESLGEIGIVGVVVLGGMLIVPLLAAIRGRRTRFVAPATGAFLAWAAAAALDWHWEMVGVTTTALLAASVALVASERRARRGMSPSARGAVVAATVVLSVAATWSLVGNQALFAARNAAAREDWVDARPHAKRAHALLFWSAEPDIVLGDAAAGLGDRAEALRNYRAAVDTDPRSWVAWLHVAQVARGAERAEAYRRVRRLNPREEGLPGD